MSGFQVMTALITPFKTNGKIDYSALGNLIREQLEEGIQGFIVCGTTAETPTLKEHEKFDILSYVIEQVNDRVPIWFGCGTNNTKETLRLVKKASYYDISGLLLVTPYYNKPSQNGLYMHFQTIAHSTDMNIMLYQVPGRCGVHFEERTLVRLFKECPNITALKHASDDYELIAHLHQQFPHIQLYSGEDKTFMKGIDQGLSGLVSVMSNFRLSAIRAYLCQPDAAHAAYLEQLSALTFLESSPAAIKYMLAKEGKCQNILRLPLVPLSHGAAKQIDAFLACDKKRQTL